MSIQKINIGTKEDGSHLWHYYSDDPVSDPLYAVITGPITGSVLSADGTPYNVTEHVIEAALEHHGDISHAIGVRYELEGHPSLTDPDAPFIHECTDICGDRQGTKSTDPTMALASSFAENAALNGLDGTGSTNVIPFASLHTATTSTTGAAENANAGSYARQALTCSAASGGNKVNSAGLTFSTLGTIAVTYLGTWSSSTYGAGNFAIGAALGASVTAAVITVASGAITFSAS